MTTDEIVAENYAVENEQATLNVERIKSAVLFGCTHVRTSAEWKAMSEAIHELRKYVLRDDCDADGAPDADNSRHGETCYYCSASTALHTLDRIRRGK